jgi:hypothetical protein
MRHGAESIFVIKYLCQDELLFETASVHEPGDPGEFFAEKKPRLKNLVKLSLYVLIKHKRETNLQAQMDKGTCHCPQKCK